MKEESLIEASDKIIKALYSSNIDQVDKIELMCNLSCPLKDLKEYERAIKLLKKK